MARVFEDPLWEDPNTKSRVRCRERTNGGSIEIIIDRRDSDTWNILIEQYSEQEIEDRTQEDIKRFREERDQRRHHERLQEEKMAAEMIFAEKLVAFELPEIKLSKNKLYKRRLRKAKTLTEVYAYSAALVIDYDLNKDSYE